jgi:hypothetical protein
MAFKPNYRRDRFERDGAARARADEKQRKKEEKTAQRKAERAASEVPSEDEQGWLDRLFNCNLVPRYIWRLCWSGPACHAVKLQLIRQAPVLCISRQWRAPSERGANMASHKFHIGQTVSYRPASRNQDAPRGAYKIIARLPQGDDGQFEYRIKNSGEAHERIAKESELGLI